MPADKGRLELLPGVLTPDLLMMNARLIRGCPYRRAPHRREAVLAVRIDQPLVGVHVTRQTNEDLQEA
jgi:hypothetical protein